MTFSFAVSQTVSQTQAEKTLASTRALGAWFGVLWGHLFCGGLSVLAIVSATVFAAHIDFSVSEFGLWLLSGNKKKKKKEKVMIMKLLKLVSCLRAYTCVCQCCSCLPLFVFFSFFLLLSFFKKTTLSSRRRLAAAVQPACVATTFVRSLRPGLVYRTPNQSMRWCVNFFLKERKKKERKN